MGTGGASLVHGHAGPEMILDLRRGDDWRRVTADWPAVRRAGLERWLLPLELPTEQPEAVQVRRAGAPLRVWERSTEPVAFGAFYVDRGFLAPGVYLTLPEGVDPKSLTLEARFPPDEHLLRDLLGAGNDAVDSATLVGWVRMDTRHRRALHLPNRAAIEFPVSITSDTQLRFSVARRVYLWADETQFTSVAVELNAGAGWREIARARLTPRADRAPDPWTPMRVDLGRWGDHEVAVRFRVLGATGVGRVAHYVADPTLVTRRSGDPRPNLLVIIVDGLRGDLEPWASGSDGLTPNLAALAERGVTFTQARSSAPWTRASIASMFSGRTPFYHGVDNEHHSARLAADIPTVASTLRARRYATLAVAANPHLDPAFGLAAGFSTAVVSLYDGSELTKQTLKALARRPHDPFFAFVFYMDTHAPWRDRPQYKQAERIDAPVRDVQLLGRGRDRRRRAVTDPTRRETAKLRALYEENVRYVDARIGELLAGLRRLGVERDTIVVVTADHGEAFGEHGDYFHGWNVYDELSRVPLIAAGPGMPAGRRVHRPVSLRGLPRLLLHWAGVEDTLGGTGIDVEALLEDRPGGAPILMTTRFRNARVDALLRWPWKLIRTPDGVELYNLEDDPGELRDRALEEPELASRMDRRLTRHILAEEAERPARTTPADEGAGPDGATVERLRALGYLDGS